MTVAPEVAPLRAGSCQAVRLGLIAVVLLLPATAFAQSDGPPTAKPLRCVGNACTGVTVDLSACNVKNAGGKTVSLEIMITDRVPLRISAVAPGETRRLPVCVSQSEFRLFTANERPPEAAAGKERKVSADSAFTQFGKRQICTGNACADVELMVPGRSCVWLENIGKHAIAVEALVAGQTLRLTLEAPDEKKAEEYRLAGEKLRAERDAAAQRRGPTKADCERRAQFEKIMKEQQTSRTPTLITPERARFDEACRKLMQAPPPATVETVTAYHSHKYSALSNIYAGATYRAQLLPANGCAVMDDVKSFKATYVSYVPPAADSKMPCTGNACADLSFEDEGCAVRNTGKRAMTVKAVAKEMGVTNGPFALEPGQARAVRGFTGCLRPAGMERVEAAYR